jgi:hypothetical protein
VKKFFKVSLIPLLGFMVTSLLIIGYRTLIIEPSCDPKFPCLCSFTCLLPKILTSALLLFVGLTISYWYCGRDYFSKLNKIQICILLGVGCFLSLALLLLPFITVVIFYSGVIGYLIIWLPICFCTCLYWIFLARGIGKM